MSVTIRKATLEDVEAIRRMHAASWLDVYPNDEHGVPYEWVRERTDSWLNPGSLKQSRELFEKVLGSTTQFYRVAVDGDKVVGFVHGTRDDGKTKLAALYTLKDFYGSGLAQRLMALTDEWFKGDKVTLEVVTYNYRAIRFYEKLGFEVVPGSDALFGEMMPTIKMMRKEKDEKMV